MMEAVRLLRQYKFSELPVVDEHDRPLGMVDITDIVGYLPERESRDASRDISPTDSLVLSRTARVKSA
jgi:Mg/Co/Ni transporter MgtE